MKNIIKYISIILIAYSCTGSTNNEQNTNSENLKPTNTRNQNINLSIFLDLSDRISVSDHPNNTMEYFMRDTGYVNSVIEAFNTHVLSKKIVMMNERVQLFLDPPPANPEINAMVQSLKVKLDKQNVTKEKIANVLTNYKTIPVQLYELANKDMNFIGSDIWGFFKNHINDYCISNEHRNILVVITDGYIYHKDNAFMNENRSSYLTTKLIEKEGLTKNDWESIMQDNDYGFIVENNSLENIEILVLGINAYNKTPFEEDVIKKYWSNWLEAMGVSKYAIKSAELPTNLDEVIKNFILKP